MLTMLTTDQTMEERAQNVIVESLPHPFQVGQKVRYRNTNRNFDGIVFVVAKLAFLFETNEPNEVGFPACVLIYKSGFRHDGLPLASELEPVPV
jgi:hypothetical protein